MSSTEVPESYRKPGDVQKTETLIKLTGVSKIYERGAESVHVLTNLDLEIPHASFEALMGPSGSGKSTLLNLIAGLDRPTSGTIEINGKRIDKMSEGELARWRADTIGFVFQSFNLLPVLTAIENVELPLLLTNVPSSQRRERAQTALRIVGLEDRMSHYPRQLSGGQEQRVAIARAIVNDPTIIVADEPTGDLDRKSAEEVLTLLETLNQELGKTIVMVTHDPLAAERATQKRHLDKGTFSVLVNTPAHGSSTPQPAAAKSKSKSEPKPESKTETKAEADDEVEAP